MGSGFHAFAPYDHLPRLRELPRDPEAPLAVHRLTTLHSFGEFAALWQTNAHLIPTAMRLRSKKARAAWDAAVPKVATTSMLLDRDEAAGDDQYLFFSLNALHRDGQQVWPAVAYDLRRLCAPITRGAHVRERPVAFRPHDLEPAYRVVDNDVNDSSPYGCDCPEDECRCTAFDSYRDVLEKIADYGTVTGRLGVLDLAKLHLLALQGHSTTDHARPYFERLINEDNWCAKATDDYLYDPDDVLTCKGVRKIHWTEPFRRHAEAGRVEILYGGALRLKDADYVCTDDGWRKIR